MSCPHSTQPGPCSQCAGFTPRLVTVEDGAVFVDGELSRQGGPRSSVYAARGGRASKLRRGRK